MPLTSDFLLPISELPIAFTTHKRYLNVLNELTYGVQLNYSRSIKSRSISDSNRKKRLIELTNKSIDAEIEVRNADLEYAVAALPWIPAKVYYLIYYHNLTLDYLIRCDVAAFNRTHFPLVDQLTAYLENGQLSFSESTLNKTFIIQELLDHREATATQLRRSTDNSTLFKMLMKNVAGHYLADQKRMRKWNRRTATGRAQINSFCRKRISIFHHSLIMRHRTNYKDMNFTENVPDYELASYFDKYISYGKSLTHAVEALCELIRAQRLTQ